MQLKFNMWTSYRTQLLSQSPVLEAAAAVAEAAAETQYDVPGYVVLDLKVVTLYAEDKCKERLWENTLLELA